ncbi:hypothetical protein COW36_04260 [bacterium (Candidatus Blackallbacteria) CG17_big_fil_post_rev_8_21_14_2_50_48_46]|uniref:FlgO domain-containing protein n=1 Tax=bacterium (Candidatus Blackallbacteria) CG17_big_fil_post_rev_8_21_14_2_50_48_46 TaxID=2014261 RepID=A0A2M7G8S5_9BACT|nr:MAG: hypothetical protein COW64_04685 [bacterium (Candidatus Blackallbacteria) CG18_big_fil_WC_8_21_14_2_50_49_26]PIW18512.1 MAG: hypothetical protein COW36_04260 [bacterium (Candidatus Blackallbacteria) CG17_big_fil_post_rev_8_21_14_2_50_48_46]PIW46503.1 MAG: hypothetical protein COW20_16420 [bacterium (Candidatus Blackallbacteria) CG13_big_fil_rev_8_21_14_2_50_49_14]
MLRLSKLKWIALICGCSLWGGAQIMPLRPVLAVEKQATLRMVVLPFRNLSTGETQEWLGESFAESLTTVLSQRPQLALIERSQLNQILREQGFGQSALADEKQAPRLGRMLGARKILVGSYQKEGERLLVQARVVDAETGQIEAGQAVRVEGSLDQIFALQTALAEQFLVRLGIVANAQERQELEKSLQVCHSSKVYAQYQQAQILLRLMSDKPLREGIRLLESALAQEPDFVEAHIALSEAYSQRARMKRFLASASEDDLPRALFHAQEALKRGKHLDAVYRATARAWQVEKKGAEALAAIRKSLQLQPGDTDSLIAYLEIASGQDLSLDQILAELKQYQTREDDPWVQFSLASILFRHLRQQTDPDYSQVRLMFNQIRAQLPQLAYVPLKQAEVALLSGDQPGGLAFLKEALALEPDNYLLYAFAGISLIKTSQYHPLAESWLKKSVELNPDFGFNLAFLGLLALQEKKLDLAREYLLKAREIVPESAAIPTFLGLVAMQQEAYPEATAYLLTALENHGKIQGETIERGSILNSLSVLALIQKKPDEAIAYAREALTSPDLAPGKALEHLLKVYLDLDRVSEARAAFQEATSQPGHALSEAEKQWHAWIYLREELQKRPNDIAVLNDLGGLALKEQDSEAAEKYLNQARYLAPENAAVAFNLGLLNMQMKNWSEAQTLLEEVLKHDPDHRKAAYNLAKVYFKLGQNETSRQILLKLLAQDPHDQLVLKALEALEKKP